MKKSSWFVLCAMVVIAVAAMFKLFLKQSVDTTPSLANSADLFNSANMDYPQQKKIIKPKKVELFLEAEAEGDLEEALQAQLYEIADLYAETSKYPITSQPVRNPEDVREYKPYEESEVDLPFPEDDGDKDPVRVSAATDAYQYFKGDVINVQVNVSRVPEDEFVKVSGVLSGGQGDLPIKLEFNSGDDSRSTFLASFDTRLAPQNLMSQEMLAKLTITLGGKELFTTVAFRYAAASAQVVGLRPSYIDGPNLVIPLELNVYQEGYYFLRAVLDDQATGQPLIQLQTEARLSQGNAVLNLSAHIAALRQQGSEGPYILRSIRSYRGAEQNEQYDAPASSLQNRFPIQAFPFSEYADEEYQDEYGQENEDFLRGA